MDQNEPNIPPAEEQLPRSPLLMNASDTLLCLVEMQQRLLSVVP